MKSYYQYLYMIILIMSFGSCKKYLDVTPDNVGTIDYAFRNRNEAENYLFTCYSALQQMQYQQYNVGFVYSSEVIFPNDLTDNQGIDPVGFNLIRGTQNSANPGLNFWDGANNNNQPLFKAIRKCNTMLENINKPTDLSPDEKKRWIAEVKFLKAFYHFYLFRLYGPIPIVDVSPPINSSIEDIKAKRAPVDSVINYIVELLDQATPDLPPVIINQARELGRITQPIALSVKAEVLSTAASPLFNGNPDYNSIKNKDGQPLFPSSYDASKWDKAAAAALEAITNAEANGIALHTYNPPANMPANLSDSLKTILTIQTAVTEKWEQNKELIWALNQTFGYQPFCGPRLTVEAASSLRFQGTWAVPISQQELFYTNKGVPINEDKTWDYAGRYTFRTGDDANRFYIGKGYETVKAHFDREPRFYADVAFDGGVFYGNGNLDQEGAYYLQERGPTSIGGPREITLSNFSGYFPKKLVNYLTVNDEDVSIVDFRMPLIRLPELYLLYAEALNEQGKSFNEIVPYINKVRTRAGLPGVVEAWTTYSRNPTKYTSKDGMRQIIHQETRIELAFEGHAGWDLRRWKELQQVLSKPLQGWHIQESTATNYYRPRTLIIPVFNVRNYLWPIYDYNLLVDDSLVQNLNW